MKLSIILTNDWELYGEGSGDFFQIQYERLVKLLKVVDNHGAKITIFAEVGQQFAHLKAAPHSRHVASIASAWEASIRNIIQSGQDVQLHWHPTWEKAVLTDDRWKLNLKTWRLADIEPNTAIARIIDGRAYLQSIAQPLQPNYKCLAFRAGAFCLQPGNLTVPILKAAGIKCDSSILPGFWDYLHFDFRKIPFQSGPYWISPTSFATNQPKDTNRILELPIHTEPVWDTPLLRKLSPTWLSERLTLKQPTDPIFKQWSRERDLSLELLCGKSDPLEYERRRAKAHPRWWSTYFLKRSAQMLDTDYTSPNFFKELVGRAVRRAEKNGQAELTLTLIGHANNSHSFANLERILSMINIEYKSCVQFITVQEATEHWYESERLIEPRLESKVHRLDVGSTS